MLYVIVGIVLLIGGGIAATFVLKAMKGKLTVTLMKNAFHCGEIIEGQLELELKKPQEARRLFVSLIGVQETRYKDDEGNDKTDRDEVYRDEIVLIANESLPEGHHEVYDFKLPTPSPGSMERHDGGGWIGQMVSMGFGGNRTKLIWSVEGRLDIPGLDLAQTKSIKINT